MLKDRQQAVLQTHTHTRLMRTANTHIHTQVLYTGSGAWSSAPAPFFLREKAPQTPLHVARPSVGWAELSVVGLKMPEASVHDGRFGVGSVFCNEEDKMHESQLILYRVLIM